MDERTDDPSEGQEQPRPELPDLGMMAKRAGEYVAVWEQAAGRLVNSEYHSEDFVDDWFTCWGKWVRDTTAVATMGWNALVAGGAAAQQAGGGDDA